METALTFKRLTDAELVDIAEHMSESHLAKHMPLLSSEIAWNEERARSFVEAKEACWAQDGLGHWAFFSHGRYVGWGGFQKEGTEWDFGLVLKQEYFGLGPQITQMSLEIARHDKRIPFVTFLLPPTRKKLRGLARLDAVFVGKIKYEGVDFLKYRIETE